MADLGDVFLLMSYEGLSVGLGAMKLLSVWV